jgi:hypothetical protein
MSMEKRDDVVNVAITCYIYVARFAFKTLLVQEMVFLLWLFSLVRLKACLVGLCCKRFHLRSRRSHFSLASPLQYKKKRLLLSGAFLVKLFSKKVFGRAEAPQEVMSNKPLLSPKEAETVSIRWA